MEQETLTIFDEQRRPLGVETRAVVHERGYWHETFHCWFFRREGTHTYLLFQRRAAVKKDYPLKLDITAAGHLLAGETPRDGVREVEEELGIAVDYQELLPVGIIAGSIVLDHFIDREFCHVYLYPYREATPRFTLQEEEVEDIVSVEVDALEALLDGRAHQIEGRSCLTSFASGKPVAITQKDLAPYSETYFKQVLQTLRRSATRVAVGRLP